jgi:aminoglycoside phosphotransferase (APT) family kinase protein
MSNKDDAPVIDESLVHRLVGTQFPQWADLLVKPVAFGGWDNRTFHLGEHMSVRMPSAAKYAEKVEKEQHWLPVLAPLLPIQIPVPLAMGKPGEGYPWHWSVYKWLEGNTATLERINNLPQFATQLGEFLAALQSIDATGGPLAGAHNFYRGGPLTTYDAEARQSIKILRAKIDIDAITDVWDTAIASTWQGMPVWVHGDVAVGNLLVVNGQLNAVIDFGGMGVGDPACDLVLAWTFFKGASREAFRAALPLDNATWARGRGWALWKALIICAGLPGTNHSEAENSWRIIDEVLNDHKSEK